MNEPRTDHPRSLPSPSSAVDVEGTMLDVGELLERFARLLEYPTNGASETCAELSARLRGAKPEARNAIDEFAEGIASLAPESLEEIYAATFDLNPACCLYAGYHLFGDSYKRGALMAKLNGEYRKRGFDTGNELPDHLSVLLRFLAGLDDDELRGWLLEEVALPALFKITRAFDGTSNLYAAAVRAAFEALRPPEYEPASEMVSALPVLDAAEHSLGE